MPDPRSEKLKDASRSPWRDPPLQKPPLDYVPLEQAMAPPLAHKPTRFSVNALRRRLTAAKWAGAVLGFIIIALWATFTA